MAEFNILPQASPPGSYVGLSEGLRSSPNTALGSLFEGLASSIDMGVKEGDRLVKKAIEDDIFDEVDAVQAEFGVPEATDLEADAEESSLATSPLGVQRAKSQLDNLQTAYARGALKESHYWARMNSMVRQLRGKYPGYRAEIDDMVAGVTGAKPANALRSSLMREWEEAANSESSQAKLADWATKNGTLPVDYFERSNSDSPYTMTELQAHIARKTRESAEVTSRRAAMALEADQGTVTAKTAEQNFRVEANQFVTSTLQDAASTAGSGFKQIQAKIQEAQRAQASGKPLPQADVDQLRGMMGELKTNVRTALHQQFIQSWDGNPKHSYIAHLDKTKMNEIIDQAMIPITTMEAALATDAPWAVLGAQGAWLEAQKSDASRELLRDIPYARKMQAISDTLGAENLSLMMQLAPQTRAEMDQVLINYWSASMLVPEGGQTITDAYSSLQSKERPGETYTALLDTWTKTADQITKGDLPLVAVQNSVQYMFGPGADRVLAMLDDSSRFAYFKKVASPAVSRQMLALKKQGDIDSWNTYQRWVGNTFQTLFTQKIQGIQDMVVDPNLYRISYDAVNSRFKSELRITGDVYVNRRYDSSINELNDALQTITPIFKENGGDTAQEVLAMLQGMGFNPNETRPSVISRMMEALLGSSEAQETKKAK